MQKCSDAVSALQMGCDESRKQLAGGIFFRHKAFERAVSPPRCHNAGAKSTLGLGVSGRVMSDKAREQKLAELKAWYDAERAKHGLLDMKFFVEKEKGLEDVASEVLALVKDKSSTSVRVRKNEDF